MDKQDMLSRLDFRAFYKNHLPSLKENGKTESLALCPFHDDHNPSLGVNLESGLFQYFSCGAKGDVFSFIQKRKGLTFKEALTELGSLTGVGVEHGNKFGKVVATYEYKDVTGKILYTKERFEPGRNGRSKDFIFRHRENGRWATGRGSDPILYNLPEVLEASKVFLVEGEGKVEALREWCFVASCLDTGS